MLSRQLLGGSRETLKVQAQKGTKEDRAGRQMVRTGQVAAEQSDSRIWNHILWLVEASRNKRSIQTSGEPDQQLCSEQPNGSSFVPLLGLQAPDEFYKIKIKIINNTNKKQTLKSE